VKTGKIVAGCGRDAVYHPHTHCAYVDSLLKTIQIEMSTTPMCHTGVCAAMHVEGDFIPVMSYLV